MNLLKVNIDKENGIISVMNNGKGIPIEMHAKEKVFVPELIFGHLLTSSNYDDDEKKVTGGRNGYGAKLCNIFSKQFIVETACKDSGKKYKQVSIHSLSSLADIDHLPQIFSGNMSQKSEPVISKNSKKEEFTKITFKPDFEKFGMENIDEDVESLLIKRVFDMAGCCNGVKVYLNDERISIRNFHQYVDMYLTGKNENSDAGADTKPVVYEVCNERWEVCVTLSEGQFQQVFS
jgi:DNA topoisomerase-2